MKNVINRPFEIKAVSEKGGFTGIASVFGELDSYRDIVVKGAFNASLQEDFAAKNRKVPMLWQHNTRQPIGVYTDIKEDDNGLIVTGECNMEVQQGRECHALMKQGALTGLSIGYDTITEKWDEKNLVRELLQVKLYEISPVTFPAGDSARVTTVKAIEDLQSLSDCESYLRDAGYSKSEALAFVSRIKAIAVRSDSAAGEAELAKTVKNALSILQS